MATNVLTSTALAMHAISLRCVVPKSHLTYLDPQQSMLDNAVSGLVQARKTVMAPVGGVIDVSRLSLCWGLMQTLTIPLSAAAVTIAC